MITRRDLVCVLLGIVLALGALAYRVSAQREEQLEQRVSNIERFLNAVVSQGQAAESDAVVASR